MSRRWLLGTALCTTLSLAQAEDSQLIDENIQPVFTEVGQSLTLVGYSDSSRQIGDNTLSPAEPAMGLQVDYQPFNSNFNMSAANFHTQPNTLANLPRVKRTYLGVGWKKQLDDAQQLGVRVDIGAVYDDRRMGAFEETSLVVVERFFVFNRYLECGNA